MVITGKDTGGEVCVTELGALTSHRSSNKNQLLAIEIINESKLSPGRERTPVPHKMRKSAEWTFRTPAFPHWDPRNSAPSFPSCLCCRYLLNIQDSVVCCRDALFVYDLFLSRMLSVSFPTALYLHDVLIAANETEANIYLSRGVGFLRSVDDPCIQ